MLRNLRPISSSAGEYPFDNGVDLYASRAISLSFSFKIFLTVWCMIKIFRGGGGGMVDGEGGSSEGCLKWGGGGGGH